jgi:hypothetical protein
LETTAELVDVMVKIGARINTERVAKGEALEVFWKGGGRWHLGPINE